MKHTCCLVKRQKRHQQPPDSTKQAETHVEELFGPLKQLFDEAHQQHPSPLAQQQDQDSSIWTHQQPPSVVKEDSFSVPVSIITQEEVEPPPDHWEDDVTASLVPSAVLNIATQDQKTFSCIVEFMPQEDVSTIPPQHVLLTCGEDLWQLFKDGEHQFSSLHTKMTAANFVCLLQLFLILLLMISMSLKHHKLSVQVSTFQRR